MPLASQQYGQPLSANVGPAPAGTFGSLPYQAPNYNQSPLGTGGAFGSGDRSGLIGSLQNQADNINSGTKAERNQLARGAELLLGMQSELAQGRQQYQNTAQQAMQGYEARIPDLLNRNLGLAQGTANTFSGNLNNALTDQQTAGADVYGQQTSQLNNARSLQAQNQSARTAEQGGIEAGYNNRIAQLMGLLGLRGREAASDIDRRFNRDQASATSDLVNRGLYNTTVTDSVRRGINEDRSRERRGLAEQLREQEIDQYRGLTGESLAAQERGVGVRNTLSNQLTGQDERQSAARTNLMNQLRGERAGLQAQGANTIAQLGESGRSTDTALARDLTGSRLQAMQQLLLNRDFPSLNDIFNTGLQVGSDVPYPVQSSTNPLAALGL